MLAADGKLRGSLAASANLNPMTQTQTAAPRLDIFEELQDSAAEFEAAARSFDDQGARIRPGPEQWSVLECIEHVIAAEKRMAGRIREAPRSGGPAPDAAREAQLAAGVRDRSARVKAPDPVVPTGKYASVEEALKAFRDGRAEATGILREHAETLESMLISHPFFGLVNGREAALMIANHARRHAAQIQECRTAAKTES